MSIIAWRIVKPYLIDNAFDGEGACIYGGRWNSKNVSIIYTAGSLSLAAMELFVHLESYEVLDSYICIPVQFPSGLMKTIAFEDLPKDWNAFPAPDSIKRIGDAWIMQSLSLALSVPSVIIPGESNYLINPKHENFNKLEIGPPQPFEFDPRLFKT